MESVAGLVRRHREVYDVGIRSGRQVSVSAGTGGPDSDGSSPMDLLLVALASCAAATLEAVIERMRGELNGLRIAVEAARTERVPRVWTEVHLTYVIRCSLEREKLARALDLVDRTCPVSVMLEAGTRLTRDLVTIESVAVAVTHPLRQRLLRPHQDLHAVQVKGEDQEGAAWFAAFDHTGLVGTAGIVDEAGPAGGEGWRVRAMAVEERVRGRGVGAELLEACLAHAATRPEAEVWCTARVAASGLYHRRGFEPVGAVYEEPALGPHLTMVLGATPSR